MAKLEAKHKNRIKPLRVLTLVCPRCGTTFHRTEDLLLHALRCPACGVLLRCNEGLNFTECRVVSKESGEYALAKQLLKSRRNIKAAKLHLQRTSTQVRQIRKRMKANKLGYARKGLDIDIDNRSLLLEAVRVGGLQPLSARARDLLATLRKEGPWTHIPAKDIDKLHAEVAKRGILVKKVSYAARPFRELAKSAARIQKLLGLKTKAVRPMTDFGVGLAPLGRAKPIQLATKRQLELMRTSDFPQKHAPLQAPVGKILAHEIAHTTRAGRIASRGALKGFRDTVTLPHAEAVRVVKRAHGPVFKSARRHVEQVMKKTGEMKKLKKLGYAARKEAYSPVYVKDYFAEMKQHGLPFTTRMQWLSRVYGGKGGYTSEELYEIVTGKKSTGYYIFPFVKNAPPEVNRILEAAYRRHRLQGDTKEAAAIAAWSKVKQLGYVKVKKPAVTWVRR